MSVSPTSFTQVQQQPMQQPVQQPMQQPAQHSMQQQSMQQPMSSAQQPVQPALGSSFGSLYTESIYQTDDDAQDSPIQDPSNALALASSIRTFDPSIPYEQNGLVQHYMSNVLPIQYLLSDSSVIRNFIYDLIRQSSSARDAACILAAMHRDRMGMTVTNTVPVPPPQFLIRRLFESLAGKQQINEGDAMAGLHAVSTILFNGGRGAWEAFLAVASQYVYQVLMNPRYPGPEEVLRNCSESTRFIVKTTMWFDVLASVTTQQIPRFLMIYRQLFDRTRRAYIEDASHPGPPELSMLPVMGCENNIVLAIAEISNLACWKESQVTRHCLSVPKLVERGLEIEAKYLTPGGASSPSQMRVNGLPNGGPSAAAAAMASAAYFDPSAAAYTNSGYASGSAYGPGAGTAHGAPEVELRRRLTNDIFRASARVYLHTVLSGDYPSCPEIVAAVTEVIECLRRVPLDKALVSRSVLRSVVFGICISGCLTDSQDQRRFLMHLLDTQQREAVGNVAEVKRLMQHVWTRRDTEGGIGQPVNWRDVMRDSQRELLLLV
ncbi:uncharacterized protein PHACADRAFT_252862 [Phanerochaete carnosa HHB-10118-sp]|uniref:Uncharacterized protein n=1 Tax=Phanerochaete carnosa (strain HHB-10118-sp) TaxID=650164 RepID=K5W3P9_PHACS|nr:uncharacterized protein PHACADRAFT_252862 [Phanerochaete carnosa HHB-10118-sp]EKM58498.1 hypothetical protein PHACADRAFT_252862 [Phanerochaete carnosa HHB-10118-sp]